MKAAILLIIVLALFFSCSVEETNTNITEIDLSIDLNPIKELKLSQIADDIEFVFLETTKSSLISSIRFIRASQNFILVLDRTRQKALLFSRNGKFLNSIGSYGKGPGEYLQVIDGFISPSEEEVVLLCNGQARSTYVFDIQGNFKSNFAHEFGPAGITSLGNSVIYHVGYPSSLVMNDGFSINIHEEDRSWRHMLKRSV